jgi:threonine synthase
VNVVELRCTLCDASYQPEPGRYVCDSCGDAGTLDVRYDYAAIGETLTRASLAADREPSMWRFRPLMPVAEFMSVEGLSVGGTPLVEASRLSAGLASLYIKDDGRQATGSLKDRASAVALARAAMEGAEVITTASTGNAAAALAGLAANTGQRAVIFVPASAPEAKVAQLLAFGATVALVDGNYGDAFELCSAAAERFGWYNRNTGYNPYVAEGKKTVSLEICEQLDWEAPDSVFVSVGDGSIVGGVHKGFKDAVALGWVDQMPRIFGIQAAGSDFITQAFESGEDVAMKAPIAADTVADSISADLPRDRVKALRAATETGGVYLRVDDEPILAAIPTVAAATGVFCEPAAAATYAGIQAALAQGLIGESDRVVMISTGSGLKDVPAVMAGVASVGIAPIRLSPELSSLDELANTL